MSFFQRAEHLLLHPEELVKMLGAALRKAFSKRKVLLGIFTDFLLLFRLVRAWVSGDYRDVPRPVIFWAIFAILYFLSPIDLIPDILPGGYIDDIFVIRYVTKRFRADLDKFAAWEKERKRNQ